ncbi:MAG: DUF2442 domain-containing protein [Clostridia bacterium]
MKINRWLMNFTKKDIIKVVKVLALDDYKLYLKFNTDEEKVFDMHPYLDMEVFKPLRNEDLFKTVRIYLDTIQWDNEIDVDPDTLYADSVSLKEELKHADSY